MNKKLRIKGLGQARNAGKMAANCGSDRELADQFSLALDQRKPAYAQTGSFCENHVRTAK